MAMTSSTISSEQFAARELVRDWAAGSGATAAVRDIEQGEPKAWQPVFEGLAEPGSVRCRGTRRLRRRRRQRRRPLRDDRRGRPGAGARPGGDHGAGHTGSVRSEAAARRSRPGSAPPGLALDSDVEFDETASQASGTVPWVLGGIADGLLLVPAGDDVATRRLRRSRRSRHRCRRASAGHRLLPAAGARGPHLGSGQRDRRSYAAGSLT